MNKILAFAAAMALAACSGHKEHADHADHPAEADGHKEHSDLIELSDHQAEQFGVAVDTIFPGEFATTIRCSGIIERSASDAATVSATTAGIVRYAPGFTRGASVSRGAAVGSVDASAVSGGDANRSALAALEAARAEVDRLQPLYDKRLATASEYNAAVAALRQAEAAYSPSAASGKIYAPIGGTVTDLLVADGAHVDVGTPLATISANGSLTLHAEVALADYPLLSSVTDARVGSLKLSEHGGRPVGTSSENGYGCIYFTFNNDGTVLPGSGSEVFLLGAPRQGVISVPLGAVVEQQGEHYVYLRHSPGHYEKQPVTLGASDGERVEITSGLSGGEAVVTSGAMTVRLAENSGVIPEGHSHSH